MIFNIHKIIWILGLLAVLCGGTMRSSQSLIKHKIKIKHPSQNELLTYELIQVNDSSGLIHEYFMEVVSVYCNNHVCEVVPVKLVWDAIGRYKRFVLDENVTLEKYNGVRFTKEDYAKLHLILANEESPFDNYSLSEIIGTDSDPRVDAVTSATMLELSKDETIAGATQTCYTLWRFAHGDAVKSIKNSSLESMTSPELEQYLKSEDTNQVLFALEAMTKRSLYNERWIEPVDRLFVDNSSPLAKASVNYLERGPMHIYLSKMAKYLNSNNQPPRKLCLNSLLEYPNRIPVPFLEEISSLLPQFNTYEEVDLYFSILEKNNVSTELILKNAFKLLDKNILIARRSYWFLNANKLNKKQLKQKKSFAREYKDSL